MKVNWREVFKFMSGVTFASTVFSAYLFMAYITVPFFFGLTFTPEISGLRAAASFLMFLLFFYFGFLRK